MKKLILFICLFSITSVSLGASEEDELLNSLFNSLGVDANIETQNETSPGNNEVNNQTNSNNESSNEKNSSNELNNIELNSAGDEKQSVNMGGVEVSNMPKTGAEHVFLIILSFLIAYLLFFRSKSRFRVNKI